MYFETAENLLGCVCLPVSFSKPTFYTPNASRLLSCSGGRVYSKAHIFKLGGQYIETSNEVHVLSCPSLIARRAALYH